MKVAPTSSLCIHEPNGPMVFLPSAEMIHIFDFSDFVFFTAQKKRYFSDSENMLASWNLLDTSGGVGHTTFPSESIICPVPSSFFVNHAHGIILSTPVVLIFPHFSCSQGMSHVRVVKSNIPYFFVSWDWKTHFLLSES